MLPFDKRDGWIWYNGDLIPWEKAQLHVLSHGLHYASCIFEGERAYNGHIFKSLEHSKRFCHSAKRLDIQLDYSMSDLEEIKKQTLKKQNLTDAYVRVVAWRGSEMMAISAQNTHTNMAVAIWEWPSYYSVEKKKKGIKLDIADWKRPAPDTAPHDAKAAGLYMICTVSKHKAERNGYSDALMMDYRGFVAEATSANIFFTKDGALHTPKADCFLNGITRQTVITLAREKNIPVVERHISMTELKEFDGCFLTGSAAEVTPVGEIKGISYPVHDMIIDLMETYSEYTHS